MLHTINVWQNYLGKRWLDSVQEAGGLSWSWRQSRLHNELQASLQSNVKPCLKSKTTKRPKYYKTSLVALSSVSQSSSTGTVPNSGLQWSSGGSAAIWSEEPLMSTLQQASTHTLRLWPLICFIFLHSIDCHTLFCPFFTHRISHTSLFWN